MKRIIPLALLLLLTLTLLIGCAPRDDATIVGTWRMISYTTDDGHIYRADEHTERLEMSFYANANGEATADGSIQYVFYYTASGGELERTIHRSSGVQTVKETYRISEDGGTLTVYSPDEGATIVLSRVIE